MAHFMQWRELLVSRNIKVSLDGHKQEELLDVLLAVSVPLVNEGVFGDCISCASSVKTDVMPNRNPSDTPRHLDGTRCEKANDINLSKLLIVMQRKILRANEK